LQKVAAQSYDIVNTMDDVATTKILIQELKKAQGWSKIISDVTSFCTKQDIIIIPDMNGSYAYFVRSRASNETTVEHYYSIISLPLQ
jgi:hypothetical protein